MYGLSFVALLLFGLILVWGKIANLATALQGM